MEFQDLQRIGLTKGEIKIYKALLDLGECTKTKLAKKSGISPSNIYDITNRLIEKGIISKVEKNGVAHFSPANPKQILNYLEEKEKEIDREKEFVASLLPMLLSKFESSEEKVNVEVFQGWTGMKTVFENLLEECEKNDWNYVFGASRGKSEQKADLFFIKYSKIRAEKGIKTKIIFNEELRERSERVDFFKKSKQYEVRFLQQSTPAEILVYKNKALLIILTESPLVIRITGQEVANSFKQYFDLMWKSAKS